MSAVAGAGAGGAADAHHLERAGGALHAGGQREPGPSRVELCRRRVLLDGQLLPAGISRAMLTLYGPARCRAGPACCRAGPAHAGPTCTMLSRPARGRRGPVYHRLALSRSSAVGEGRGGASSAGKRTAVARWGESGPSPSYNGCARASLWTGPGSSFPTTRSSMRPAEESGACSRPPFWACRPLPRRRPTPPCPIPSSCHYAAAAASAAAASVSAYGCTTFVLRMLSGHRTMTSSEPDRQ
jgi:hypothetical protein